jgi:hypothetical protein
MDAATKRLKADNAFPFNSLSCTQTPFQFPKNLSQEDLPEYKTSEIRIVGSSAGPGRLLDRAAKDGQTIEESPQLSLIFERQTFNVSDTILHFPGMHRAPGSEKPPAGEIHIYFRNNKPHKRLQVPADDVCLIIPIKIGSGKGVDYFEFLNRDAGLRSDFFPAITTILTDKTPAILYKGKDLKNRGCGLPNSESICLPEAHAIQYIFLQEAINCRIKDAERLKDPDVAELEAPSDPISITDLRRFCAICKAGLRVGSTKSAPNELPDGVKRMDALKCRVVDTKKDIKGDKIIINPKARDVYLPNELGSSRLEDQEDGIGAGASSDSTFQPGDFEDLIAVPIGIITAYYTTAFLVRFIDGIVWKI